MRGARKGGADEIKAEQGSKRNRNAKPQRNRQRKGKWKAKNGGKKRKKSARGPSTARPFFHFGHPVRLQPFNGVAQHALVHLDVALRRGEVLVPGQGHDDLGRGAVVRQLRDERAAPAVAGRPVDAGLAVDLTEQLVKGIRRKGRPLLRHEQRALGLRALGQLAHIALKLPAQARVHENGAGLTALRVAGRQRDLIAHSTVLADHVTDLELRHLAHAQTGQEAQHDGQPVARCVPVPFHHGEHTLELGLAENLRLPHGKPHKTLAVSTKNNKCSGSTCTAD